MKNIKSFIIGFLLSTCVFLFMGLGNRQAATYQIIYTNNNEFITYDTQNGEIVAWYALPTTVNEIKEYNNLLAD